MAVSDDYQDALERLARTTAEQVQDQDDPLLLVAVLNRARAEATALADVFLARQLEDLTGDVVTTTGVLPTDDSERLAKAVSTVLSGAPKTRFTRAEIRDLILSAGLNPEHYHVAAVTEAINRALLDYLPEEPGHVPDYGDYSMADFVETLAEHQKSLRELGMFPAPLPHTGGVDPERDAKREAWEAELPPDIDSDDFDDFDPIWTREPEDAGMRLERLARSEVFTAAQNATTEALTKRKDKRGRYVGWVRQLEPGHCQLCEWWSREGRVFPKNHKMASHPNCNCVQKIVISDTKPKPIRSKRRGK